LYAECYDYGNFENKVKRYRLWRRDGRAAAPIASGSFRISTLSGVSRATAEALRAIRDLDLSYEHRCGLPEPGTGDVSVEAANQPVTRLGAVLGAAMAPPPTAAPSAPVCWNRTPIGAAAVPFPTPILTAKFRRGGPALATTGSSQDNPRLLCFLNGFYL